VLSLPATISSGFGFMFFYGRQLRAMGESGLLNPIFARELPGRHTPVGALMLGSLLGYGLCLVTFFVPTLRAPLNNLSKLCAYATYLSILLSYWVFRGYFPNIMREFVSPLGKAGAAYGMTVFGLSFISIAAFQDTSYVVVVFAVMILIATAYYYLVVEKRQVFSEEEKTVMFKAYLVKGERAVVCNGCLAVKCNGFRSFY
jgi:L-asparagine transporter-like permease